MSKIYQQGFNKYIDSLIYETKYNFHAGYPYNLCYVLKCFEIIYNKFLFTEKIKEHLALLDEKPCWNFNIWPYHEGRHTNKAIKESLEPRILFLKSLKYIL